MANRSSSPGSHAFYYQEQRLRGRIEAEESEIKQKQAEFRLLQAREEKRINFLHQVASEVKICLHELADAARRYADFVNDAYKITQTDGEMLVGKLNESVLKVIRYRNFNQRQVHRLEAWQQLWIGPEQDGRYFQEERRQETAKEEMHRLRQAVFIHNQRKTAFQEELNKLLFQRWRSPATTGRMVAA